MTAESFERLIASDKKPIVANAAFMKKMPPLLNAMTTDNTGWHGMPESA